MRLLVVRHGQSEADILKVCEGLANYSLADCKIKLNTFEK